MENAIHVRDLAEYFKLRQIVGNDESLDRTITVTDLNRCGLELTGYFDFTQFLRVVLLGDKEIGYITNRMSDGDQYEYFEKIMSDRTPCIIISKNHPCPPILEMVASKKNFPVFSSDFSTNRLMNDITSYLEEKLAETTSLHGVLVSVYGRGVLLTGESGSGKSEIALELLKRGHFLVADDRVDVAHIHNAIVGFPPEILAGMLEIRGIGIIDVTKMFGANAVLSRKQVDVIIHLEKWDSEKEYKRAGIEDKEFQNILDIEIPKITIPIREGRSLGVLIESAVTNFILQERGIDSAKEFDRRIMNLIMSKNNDANSNK